MGKLWLVNHGAALRAGDLCSFFTDSELLERVPKMFLILGAIFFVMEFIGTILLVTPPPVKHKIIIVPNSRSKRDVSTGPI